VRQAGLGKRREEQLRNRGASRGKKGSARKGNRSPTRRLGNVFAQKKLLLAGLLLAIAAGWFLHFHFSRENRFDAVILDAARRYKIDPALVKAVIWKESQFNAHAVGRAGERGLMQLMDPAAQEWAEAVGVYPLPSAHLFNPRTNILAGTWFLAQAISHYPNADDPYPYGLAEYNAGRRNVLRWAEGTASTNSRLFIEQIDYPSTKRYVRAILARRKRYLTQFPLHLRGLGQARQRRWARE